MKYGQGFGNFAEYSLLIPVSLVVILLTMCVLYGMQKWDKDVDMRKRKGHSPIEYAIAVCLCILCAVVIVPISMGEGNPACTDGAISKNVIGLSVLAGALFTACAMDRESCMIYNYVWLSGGLAGIGLILGNRVGKLWELVIFILLQEFFFAGMYGRADCHGFVVCAIAETALGMGMKEFLFHMLIAFSLLAIIQGWRHNIGKNGNLKKTVAFFPYVTGAFWILLLGKLFSFCYDIGNCVSVSI